MTEISRRRFVQTTAIAGSVVAASPSFSTAENKSDDQTAWQSQWHRLPNRVWIGAEFWANPLQDWRIEAGRIECLTAKANRHLHLLTHQLSSEKGTFRSSVTLGVRDLKPFGQGQGSAGFRIGIQGPLQEYRNNLIFGKGLDVGLTAKGSLFIGNKQSAVMPKLAEQSEVKLQLEITPARNAYQVSLTARGSKSGDVLGEFSRTDIADRQLTGNVALIANVPGHTGKPGQQPSPNRRRQNSPNGDLFWFADWQVSGTKLTVSPEHTFGPEQIYR